MANEAVSEEAGEVMMVEVAAPPPLLPHSQYQSQPLSHSLNTSPDNTIILPDTLSASIAVPPPPPPPPQHKSPDLHPIISILRDQELGKATLALVIPIAMAILVSKEDKLTRQEMSFILVALSLGCAAILNGILLRDTSPRCAKVSEPLGVALVFISFHSFVAFLLPVQLFWVPAVCLCLSLLPFMIATWDSQPSGSSFASIYRRFNLLLRGDH